MGRLYMEQYCIYLRKSRADVEAENMGEEDTFTRHERTLLELAKKLRLPITKIYKELVSGETIAARPVMQQLLNEVDQGLWAGVLVMEVERLARGDTIDQGIVSQTFKANGTKIITPLKTYDPNNEFDEEYFEFGLFMSRREYKTINRRLQRGRLASVNEGKIISSTAPYGYDRIKIKDAKGYTLTPNPDEAPVVKLIFDLYTNTPGGIQKVADKLNAMQIKLRHKDFWTRSTVTDILDNPVYIGKVRWGYRLYKKYIVNGKLKSKRLVNPNCYFIDGIHPPLVSEEVFFKAQTKMKNNRTIKVKIDNTLKNPLSGLVYCKMCGSLMTREGPGKRHKIETLACHNSNCDNVSAPLVLIESKIIEYLNEWVINYKLKTRHEDVNNTEDSVLVMKKKKLKELQREVEKIDKQIDQTYDLLEREVYTVEVFTQRHQKLNERKADTLKAIAELESDIASESGNAINKNMIPVFENVLECYNKVESAEEKNMLLKQIVSRVEYIKTVRNTRGKAFNDNFEVTVYPLLPK